MDSDERVNKPVCLIELRKLKSISQQLKEIRSNWKKKKANYAWGEKNFQRSWEAKPSLRVRYGMSLGVVHNALEVSSLPTLRLVVVIPDFYKNTIPLPRRVAQSPQTRRTGREGTYEFE